MMKKRKPWLAGLLSFFSPGLGHFYSGQLATGLFLIGLYLIAPVFWSLSLLFPGNLLFLILLAGGFLFAVLIYCFQVGHAVWVARQQGEQYELKSYNKWYVYLIIWFLLSLVIYPVTASFIRTFFVKAYKIPHSSMAPTLLGGDHIFVNKLAYGIPWPADCQWEVSDLPLECYSSKLVFEFQKPQRGDVIVFRFPEDETKEFIKRIIGLPGDTLEIKEKVVFLNGEPMDDSNYTQRIDPEMVEGSVNPRDNFGPVTVPEDSYFVLGDNRDQSLFRDEAIRVNGFTIINYIAWLALVCFGWVAWRKRRREAKPLDGFGGGSADRS